MVVPGCFVSNLSVSVYFYSVRNTLVFVPASQASLKQKSVPPIVITQALTEVKSISKFKEDPVVVITP